MSSKLLIIHRIYPRRIVARIRRAGFLIIILFGLLALTLGYGSEKPVQARGNTPEMSGGGNLLSGFEAKITRQKSSSILLAQGFDAYVFPPADWGTAIVNGSTQGWSRVISGTSPATLPFYGSGMAKFKSEFMPGNYSTRLFTSPLDFTGQSSLLLNFWMYHDTGKSSQNDRIEVQISTDGGANYSTLTAISRYDGSSGWKKHSIDLSAYAGQNAVRLGLLGISAFGNNIYIDHLSVSAPQVDYSTSKMSVSPAGLISSGQILTYTLNITNTGEMTGAATSLENPIPQGTSYVPGSAGVVGGGTLNATDSLIQWNGSIAENQVVTITFQVSVISMSGDVINTAAINDPSALQVTTIMATSPIRVVNASWPMQGYNAQRTGRGLPPGPMTNTLRWTYDLEARLQDNGSPVIGPDGTIYQPTNGTLFYVFRPDGTIKWSANVLGGVGMRNAPALSADGNTLYIYNSTSFKVFALNASNGSVLWEYPINGVNYSSFAVDSAGTIYIGTREPAMYAINSNGTLKWRYASPATTWIEAPPAVDSSGNVYFVQNIVGLVALDASGNFKWSKSGYSDYDWPTPLIGPDGAIYVSGKSPHFLSAYYPDGTLKWERADITRAYYYASLAISEDGQTLYTARLNGMVYALSTQTGATLWSTTIPNATDFGGSPVLGANGVLYLVGNGSTTNGWVYALSAYNGAVLWQYELNSPWMYWGPQSPALGPDGALYVIASGNLGFSGGTIPARMYAFGSLGGCPANITVNPATLPDMQTGTVYTQTLNAAGGIAPYVFAPSSGKIPAGMNLSTEGVFSGTPTTPGVYTFTITTAGANGCTGSRAYSLNVISLYLLSVSKNGNGAGTITSTTAGIDCGMDCSENYLSGEQVTLVATASVGSTFAGWGGACGGTESCVVTMTEAKNVTATFTLNSYSLSVDKTGAGSGVISSTPGGINCGTDCQEDYWYNTEVTLIATASVGSTFFGWDGACSGIGFCTVFMDAARNVIANFSLNSYLLTVNKSGSGSGTITSSPDGINCGADCAESFLFGTQVTLIAVPSENSTFTGWSGACSGLDLCAVSIDAVKDVTAGFGLKSYIFIPMIIR
jgi:uncharacterized repeat protein (TIGR01451 family)